MKKGWTSLIALLLALSLVACGNQVNQETGSNNVEASENEQPAQEAEGTTAEEEASSQTIYPLTLQDATGESFTFDQAPQRIVSTSPSETEILFALGLEDQVVGVSDYDNYPSEALDKPKVGGVVKPNEEAIIAAEPDLVITGISMKQQVVDQLRSRDLKLFKFEPNHIGDILTHIETIGKITNRQAEAAALVEEMKADIQLVQDAVSTVKPEDRKKVYIEFSKGWTVGQGEFMHELITLAGGINIAADMEGWNQINEEKIIQDNPEVILYNLGVTDEESGETLAQMIRKRSGWDAIQAIQDDALIGIEGDLISRPGPRVTQGLLAIAKGIYPDLVFE
ncbi:ABC transporter substrate-binding protein [Marinicrinis sediminis]|uniref:ABC transporter substrate-binding protein n=1 Tax=Marinicrinis sediminis TaxID=1652465 RepID=A0ABW5R880_9BACL